MTSLLLYGTDTLYSLPRTVKHFTLGSAPGQNIAIPSPFVSAQHCRLDRQRTSLRVTDVGSKNGTYFDGAREHRFYLTPGKAFIAGARPHRFLALNDEMRTSYPALVDILGAESERTIGSAADAPSPSDVIMAAVAGVHLLITGEPHCEQDRLARIIHKISLFHERPMIELTPDRIPTDRKEQSAFMKQTAARSTFVLDLGDDPGPLRSRSVSMVFAAKQQVQVIVLARTADIVYKALGWQHCDKLQHVWLRPVASRPGAIPPEGSSMADRDLPAGDDQQGNPCPEGPPRLVISLVFPHTRTDHPVR